MIGAAACLFGWEEEPCGPTVELCCEVLDVGNEIGFSGRDKAVKKANDGSELTGVF